MPPTHPSQADVAAAYRTLIAHETEPKEQDFYRTRLQRLEPRTEPESDDFVTQLAVKQIEGEAAWWRSIDFDRNASRTFESMTGDSQQAVRTGVERVLAHLTAAGRLVPAGGMALTAEQVEDVRTVSWYTGAGLSRAPMAEIHRLRALFPATEPAEEVGPVSFYRAMTRKFATEHFGFPEVTGLFERTHTASDGGVWGYCGGEWELREYPPAPAEPAEEETKAETDGERDALAMWLTGYGLPDLMAEGIATALLHDYQLKGTASSPVVPAPTETGPWQHRVNGEICVASPASGLPYTIGKFNDHGDFVWHSSSAELPEGFAPFVAAEEG